jgi:hypothetical protein
MTYRRLGVVDSQLPAMGRDFGFRRGGKKKVCRPS